MTGKKRPRRVLLIALGVLAALAAAFFLYCSDYYPAGEAAMAVLDAGEGLTVLDGCAVLTPTEAGDLTGTGLVFYPGAKVEESAYLPLLESLREAGLTCVLVKMPFHMAIFSPDAAEKAMEAAPEVERWYIAGHSMGGAMASSFAAGHPDEVEGLILLGAYPYGEYPTDRTLTVYGSLNESVAEKIDYTENVVVIQGGNHAQFGDYGPQRGDAEAAVTAEDQRARTAEAILAFVRGE